MARKSKKELTLAMIETTNFNDINWADYKDQVIAMKDDLEFLYGKRFYKRIMYRIEGKRTWLEKLLRRQI